MTWYWIKSKGNFHQIYIVDENHLVKQALEFHKSERYNEISYNNGINIYIFKWHTGKIFQQHHLKSLMVGHVNSHYFIGHTVYIMINNDQKSSTMPSEAYVSMNWVIIGSGNGLLPVRHQAIAWTNAGLMSIAYKGPNFKELWTKIHKIHLRILFAILTVPTRLSLSDWVSWQSF